MIEGTIIKGIGGQYTVDCGGQQYICKARGLFRKKKETPLVGDRVRVKADEGLLMEILPRRNELKRPRVANVDQVVIVLAAAQPDLHFTMLDRYLMQAEYEKIPAAVCVNKNDLDELLPVKVRDLYEAVGYPVFIVSAADGLGFGDLTEYLRGKVTVLAGPSGVGKTSIINIICDGEDLKTGAVSERIGRGKHTTRHTEFVSLNESGYVIDTPGFSSLAPPDVPRLERAELFKEFRPWLGGCRFHDCLHMSEDDCAVKEQIGKTIDPGRYDRYIEWISD